MITGVAGGIGQATAQYFAEKGWVVIGIDRAPFGEPFPENGTFLQADVSREEEWNGIFRKVEGITGHLDALVNNAAVQITKPILKTTIEEWDRVMDANLRAVFVSAKLAHPLLKAGGGGAIVNVSSVHAVATSKNIASYAASKGGLLALTRAMAIEFAPDDIRVNAILPDAVDTPMLRAGMNRDHAGEGTIKQR